MLKYLLIFLLFPVIVFGQLELSKQTTVKFGDKPCVTGNINRDLTMSVGDSKSATFKPQLKIEAWGGECLFTIDLRTDTMATMSHVTKTTHNLSDKMTMTQDALVSHEIYKRDDGNLEWEIILASKPDTNVFEWDIETSGYEWLYQPTIVEVPLEIGEGRPDSVEGSYAVYHATKGNDFVRIRGKDTTYENYRTGKAFHIYRPKVIDDAGKTSWCILHVDTLENKLTVIVPQKFLDDAKYPVTIDPTFGFSSEGGANLVMSKALGNRESVYTLSTGATDYEITEFHAYLRETEEGTASCDIAAYTVTVTNPVSRLAVGETFLIDGSTAMQYDITGLSQSLAQSTKYTICLGDEDGAVSLRRDYSTGANSLTEFPPLLATWIHWVNGNHRITMWATYEEAGEEPEPTSQVIFIP